MLDCDASHFLLRELVPALSRDIREAFASAGGSGFYRSRNASLLVAGWQQKRHWTSARRSSGLEILEEMEQMMTIAFDDTVDILHVVHDKPLMKDMIAAQTIFERKSRPARKIHPNAVLSGIAALICPRRFLILRFAED